MSLELISITALLGFGVFQIVGFTLCFITAIIESKFIYYLKKGVN